MENSISIRFDYSKLKNTQYVGEFGEQLVRLNFIANSIDTFIPIIDDSAIDFIAKVTKDHYFDVQVKTVRLTKSRYFYETKRKWGEEIRWNLLIAFVILQQNEDPLLLLIPGEKWNEESLKNTIFSNRDYSGKKSNPEWGLQIERKNLEYLRTNYELNKILDELKAKYNRDSVAEHPGTEDKTYSEVINSRLTINELQYIFEQTPAQWSLRGDPFLWEDLKNDLDAAALPRSAKAFYNYIHNSFRKYTNSDLVRGKIIHVRKYEAGGMSSGQIDSSYWIDTVIPHLLRHFGNI